MRISLAGRVALLAVSLALLRASPGMSAVDADGWTVFARSADTRVVYVCSSQGNDSNSGQSETQALKSVARGCALLRTGYPDWLLFKKGDVWTNEAFEWRLSGRSRSEPMLVSSYGTGARPLFRTGSKTGISVQGGGGAPPSVGHLAFAGLSFYANTRDPSSPDFVNPPPVCSGFFWLLPTNDVLFEDCVFRFYDGVGIEWGPDTNIRFRRTQVLDSYAADGAHSQGLFAAEIDSLLIEECLFDHNGWNERVNGADATVFNHNMYIQTTCRNVVVRGNISIRASSHGLQLRPGGVAEDNLFVRDPISLLLGGGDHPVAGGVLGTVHANVILEGTDINNDPANPRGMAMDFSNIKSAQVASNVVAHVTHRASGSTTNQRGIPNATGVTYSGNVEYDWGPTGPFTTPGPFPDPNRSVVTYNASRGGAGTFDDFAAELRLQSRDRWRTDYTAVAVNDYIRQGFGMAPIAAAKNAPNGHKRAPTILTSAKLRAMDEQGMAVYDLRGQRICVRPATTPPAGGWHVVRYGHSRLTRITATTE
jgi:hypothetical protein